MTTHDERPHLLILGANGRLGLAAAQAFAARGWQVTAALRGTPAPGLPAGVRICRAALQDSDALARAAHGARWVLHAVNPPYTRWAQELLPLAEAGIRVAQRLQARLLLPGNVYNYGSAMPSRLLPDTPQQPDTRKGRLRVALEERLQAAAAEGLVQTTVLRAGDFFGCGSGTWFDQAIVKSLAVGRLVYPGPLDRPHAWAYLPDLAGACVALAERPPAACAPFERFHFPGHTLTGAGLLDGIAQAAAAIGQQPARPWRRSTLPWPLIRAGGWLVPMWRELAEMAYLWEQPHALDGQALEAAVGPLPQTAIGEALRRTLQRLEADRGALTAAAAT